MPPRNNGYVRKGQSFQIGDRVVKLPHSASPKGFVARKGTVVECKEKLNSIKVPYWHYKILWDHQKTPDTHTVPQSRLLTPEQYELKRKR